MHTAFSARRRCMGCAARVRLESSVLDAREVRAALADADRRLTRG